MMTEASKLKKEDTFTSIRSFGAAVTVAALASNQSWPTVRIPYLESYGDRFLDISKGEHAALAVLVQGEDRPRYEQHMIQEHAAMMQEAHMLQYGNLDLFDATQFTPFIAKTTTPEGTLVRDDEGKELYVPVHLNYPPSYDSMNWNVAASPMYANVVASARQFPREIYTSAVRNATDVNKVPMPFGETVHPQIRYFHAVMDQTTTPTEEDATAATAANVVGILTVGTNLDLFTTGFLPNDVTGIMVVFRNTCNQNFTYVVNGKESTYVGPGDLHQEEFESFEVKVNLTDHDTALAGECLFTQSIYPTTEYRESFKASKTPKIFAVTVAVTFILVALVFAVYDYLVNERNKKVVENAARSNAIVTQLFPGNLREQIVARKEAEMQLKKGANKSSNFLKSFVEGKNTYSLTDTTTKPVAELFLEATVIFADIVGFTAWSSVREPAQVFTLLETVYHRFDEIAKRRRVFKVETVGDCYVAATGLPDPRPDHATAMMRFAADILNAMKVVTRDLETKLGPDTSDLDLRIGVHSGQVTAGVLRGERARLQLFGDTMNTAARIESTSKPGRIQLSKETGELVIAAGKGHWIEKREEKVEAKGKGALETFFLKQNYNRQPGSSSGHDNSESSASRDGQAHDPEAVSDPTVFSEKTNRLIDWNVETLVRLLKQLVGRRKAISQSRTPTIASAVVTNFSKSVHFPQHSDYLKEVKEIITFPEFDGKVDNLKVNVDEVKLPSSVHEQLRTYVSCIAGMYQDNHFHNFDHASHVLMSVTKLMSRIVAPSHLDEDNADALHDHTYGITSDPLTQFACAFSALIHDVDHTGVPNAQLIKENADIADYYKNRSVAEQNSLDLSWRLLMDPQFDALRSAICGTEDELSRFRKLVVNSVMATDIVDKELKQLRNERWNRAFHADEGVSQKESKRDATNRKATIVIEHLIQASDVAHTMQHWHVYRKWNERFFMECYTAYKSGRAETDPSVNWYEGELGFFDFYIIPLAKKLKECGVFGVSSGEYLDYATKNRNEWAQRGRDVVETMLEKMQQKQ
uniref:Phosphodiesterase n=1 Tax=Amphora coffeiformis TaxID=265554 RepID=A0A7S3L4M9_9STRA